MHDLPWSMHISSDREVCGIISNRHIRHACCANELMFISIQLLIDKICGILSAWCRELASFRGRHEEATLFVAFAPAGAVPARTESGASRRAEFAWMPPRPGAMKRRSASGSWPDHLPSGRTAIRSQRPFAFDRRLWLAGAQTRRGRRRDSSIGPGTTDVRWPFSPPGKRLSPSAGDRRRWS